MGDNKENCMIKTKAWFLEFYKSPCFLLKLFLSLTAVILAIIGIYKIAASALFYFDEPLSSFDPERLGQLGDFLGGTLNPIFGFLTVCLLLWSVFIQRKELKESGISLRQQAKWAKREYLKKEIEKELEKANNEKNEIINDTFPEITYNAFSEDSAISHVRQATSLIQVIRAAENNTIQTNTDIFSPARANPYIRIVNQELQRNIQYIVTLTCNLLSITETEIIKTNIIKNSEDFIKIMKKSGFIEEAEWEEYTRRLQNAQKINIEG